MTDTLERLVRLMKRNMRGERCHLLVGGQEHSNDTFDGYKSLAALLQARYFLTIVTTDRNDLLERALEQLSVLPSSYQILTFGRDPNEKIAMALDGQERGICIIKLPTSPHTPFAADIQESLRGYLSEDIIVFGCIDEPLRAVVQTLSGERVKSSMYYVVPAHPDAADIFLCHLQQRHKQYENFLICGSDGEFAQFFNKLAGILLYNDLPSLEGDIIVNGGQYSQTEREATDTSNDSTLSILQGQSIPEDRVSKSGQSPGASEIRGEESVVSPDEYLKEEEPPNIDSEFPEEVIDDTGSSGDGLIKTGPLTLDPILDRMKNAIRQLPWPVRFDVLIVTVTQVELRAVLEHHPARVRTIIREKTYYDLGNVGQARTAVVQANHMGPLDAQATVDEGIRALSPRAVIMTGIAFGVRTKGQQIGDVLVARLIHDYDSERIGTDADNQQLTQQRGTRVNATGWLLDRFNVGSHHWPQPPEVHVGTILSGSKLVDNREYQNALLHSAQDAIGGEMEGTGLLKATERHRVGWLLIKGISDWGDGTKGKNKVENQKLAAKNAARFVLFVIGQKGFTRKS